MIAFLLVAYRLIFKVASKGVRFSYQYFFRCWVLFPFRLVSLCTRINQNNKVQAKQWRRRWLWLWRWWFHDDDNIVDVWTMLTLPRCPIVLRTHWWPSSSVSIPHAPCYVRHSASQVPVHFIDALRQIMSLNCTRPGFQLVQSCQARNEKLHCQMPKFPAMMMYGSCLWIIFI